MNITIGKVESPIGLIYSITGGNMSPKRKEWDRVVRVLSRLNRDHMRGLQDEH